MTDLTALQFALITNIMHSEYGELFDTREEVLDDTRMTWDFSAFENVFDIPEASRGGLVAQAEAAGLVGFDDPEDGEVVNGELIRGCWVTRKGAEAWLDACEARDIDYRNAGACRQATVCPLSLMQV